MATTPFSVSDFDLQDSIEPEALSILVGMAQLFWWDAWANHQDELLERGLPYTNTSGAKIEELADEIQPQNKAIIVEHVTELAKDLIAQNCVPLWSLFLAAMAADKQEPNDEEAVRFGECIAWMSIGAGVSWFDDHAKFPLVVPYGEFGEGYLMWDEDDLEDDTEDAAG